MKIPSQINVACRNYLCSNIRAFYLFGIESEEDKHLMAVENIHVISVRSGLPSKRSLAKRWKLKVKPETPIWNSELEVKLLTKSIFEKMFGTEMII